MIIYISLNSTGVSLHVTKCQNNRIKLYMGYTEFCVCVCVGGGGGGGGLEGPKAESIKVSPE